MQEVHRESGLRFQRPQRERRLIPRRLLESAGINTNPASKSPLQGQDGRSLRDSDNYGHRN
jgi:hypothetical protein